MPWQRQEATAVAVPTLHAPKSQSSRIKSSGWWRYDIIVPIPAQGMFSHWLAPADILRGGDGTFMTLGLLPLGTLLFCSFQCVVLRRAKESGPL